MNMQNSDTLAMMDSWEARLKNAAVVLGKTLEEVEVILATLGVAEEATRLEMLSDEEVTPFGDLRRAFCEEADVKIAQLRMAIKYLRGPKNAEKATQLDTETILLKQNYGYKTRLSDIDPVELIIHYNPSKVGSKITNILKSRFGEQPVIAFYPSSKEVAVAETMDYLADLQQGYPEQETIEVDGSLVRLYPVGVIPDQTVDEDPLFEGVPLRRGRSTINRVNWGAVKQNARQFCRLVVEAEEVNPNNKLEVRALIKLAENGIDALKEVYADVDLEYRERTQNDTLPKLRMKISEIKSGKVNNPFGVSNRNY
jgi:hypothetical protein